MPSQPVFLQHHELNRSAWDTCVQQSTLPLPYAISWYLDVVAPGWCGIVQQHENGAYAAVFPVPVKSFFGMGLVYQPPFCQQLGVFALPGVEYSLVDFLAALPESIKKVQLQLHTGQQQHHTLPAGYTSQERVTHHLDLCKPYPVLLKGYKGNLRRAIQKPVDEMLLIKEGSSAAHAVKLFRKTKGKEVSALKPRHYRMLLRLCEVLQQKGLLRILEFRSPAELISASVFVEFSGRIIYLFAANSLFARQTSANGRLLDHLIKEKAGQPLLLDFEGGNIPGIGHFFRSFGAVPVPFVSLSMNRMPWPLSKVLS